MLLLVLAHVAAALVAPLLVRRLGRWSFLALALAPLAATVWALAQTGRVLDGETVTEVVPWVPGLDLDLALRLGTLQWVMVLVVAGIGVLVMAYCPWYFTGDEPLTGFATSFTAFVGAMLGLVLADDLLVLFVFWELTTIFSFLLIGFEPTKRAGRLAALQALMVTTFGGLAMFVGMLLLGREAGTFRVSEVLAAPPTGTATTVAVLLLLLGAVSKSAQLPLHFWLPGAMAAPTPVSAYLHAASMVKAGIYLVALLAPAFSVVPGWHLVLLTLGATTMLAGGWKALRQNDIKLLLAYGTVSQLGFLMTILAIGSRTAALAGTAVLLAHALFKATLFLVVGVVDSATGTRDLHELSGLGRRLPVLAVAACAAGASMAGVPPLLGFVGKETVWSGLLELSRGETEGVSALAGTAVLVALVAGSCLTAAYTARFLWGAFAAKPDVEPTELKVVPPAAFCVAPVVLAVLGLVLGFAGSALTAVLSPYAGSLPSGGAEEYLALWHGLGVPLLLSVVSVVVGLLLFVVREPLCRFQARFAVPVSAEQAYRLTVRGVDRVAVEVTGAFQRGSVSVYLAVILTVVLLAPGGALVAQLLDDGTTLRVVPWDRGGQPLVALVVAAAAIMTVRSRRRLRAVVLAGVTGYGCALLFLLHGAPDIALTQVLVETVTLVVFVLVLRRLPAYFTDRPLRVTRFWRMGLAAGVGLAVAGFVLVGGSARTATPISVAFPEAAYEFGYGRNVVNVTLVDIRAWDTFGEISVLVAAATGVASLVLLDTRGSGIRRVHEIPYPAGVDKQPTNRGRRVWLPGPRTLRPDRRSIVFEVVTRLTFHTVVVFSIYLLLAGHNVPGGGFAAGVVMGLALMIRYLAGGRYELDEAAPVDAGVLIGTGLFVAALAGLGPTAFGGAVLQTADAYVDVPLLGELKLVSSVGFDVGVYLVVVGLVLDLLRTFGARLDRQILRAEREAEQGARREA